MDSPRLTADDVARGVCRLLWRMGAAACRETPLGNGRRADLMAVDGAGRLTLVEIKVSLADLNGDRKWPEYLDYCDRFYWAVPPAIPPALFDADALGAGRTGLIVADAFDAVVLTEAPLLPLSAARRKAELARFAMRAASRLMLAADPELSRSEAA